MKSFCVSWILLNRGFILVYCRSYQSWTINALTGSNVLLWQVSCIYSLKTQLRRSLLFSFPFHGLGCHPSLWCRVFDITKLGPYTVVLSTAWVFVCELRGGVSRQKWGRMVSLRFMLGQMSFLLSDESPRKQSGEFTCPFPRVVSSQRVLKSTWHSSSIAEGFLP